MVNAVCRLASSFRARLDMDKPPLPLGDEMTRAAGNKFHARKTTLDGITFDSLSESRRYSELKILERVGEISNLAVHPSFPIVVNDKKVCSYIADFAYVDSDGREVVEDVKSPATRKLPAYRLKRKLMIACYGVTISEV